VRVCARIELGHVAGATDDVEEVQRITGTGRTNSEAVASVRALLLLRTGRYEDALRIAQGHLQDRLAADYGLRIWSKHRT
jgi:hypothetical protein